MKIYTLVENTTLREDLTAEHGLSLYVETGEHRILFDAGQSGCLAENAEKMGVDLGSVEFAVLSHGHYDHGGGLPRFLQVNSRAPVYVNEAAFGEHYNGTRKYIGLPESLQGNPRIVLTGNSCCPAPGISLTACNDRELLHPVESFGLNVCRQGCFREDHFNHEQYMLVEERGKRILFSGCSHKGILNIVSWFQPDVLIGGFHFKKLDPRQDSGILKQAAQALLQYPTQYYTCHCTGTAQYACMKQVMGDRLSYLSTGSVLTL